MPDISYDLDGDGYVGGRDYVLAKMFDKDGDGKLNTSERKAADEAVRNVSVRVNKSFQGIEKQFVWNIEQAGAQRPFRIMQRRGVIIDAEDFIPITSTYPEHPLSKVVPTARD